MIFNEAQTIASKLLEAFAPACHRIEIAGSIRRRKADVKDIELVAIPRWHVEPHTGVQIGLDMVEPTKRVNVLAVTAQAFEESDALWVIKSGAEPTQPTLDAEGGQHAVERWHLDQDGRYWRLYLPHRRMKVDVFLVTPETWGCALAYRTGAADFSAMLLARWKAVSGGGESRDLRLTRPDGTRVDTPEERDVFEACQVRYLEPERRVDANAVRMYALDRPAVPR